MRSTVRPDVRDFFECYERAAREPNPEALTSAFAPNFLSLDSRSATTLTPQTLLAALPRRRKLFESIGSDGLQLDEIEETPLDDYHTLVRTSWRVCVRDAPSKPPMILRSTFVLRNQGGAWRIVLYLNHQDMADFFESGGKRLEG
ncbi:MAG: DUF4440 domain-containing protein [Solirubrobacterales bacterium]|nr:DUF4440 domain-containing protein [Solirubrobacterales bacterium]